jgi:hypothetical protein
MTENKLFPWDPYAFLVDGVVTEVVSMQHKTEEEIEEEISNHPHDEVVVLNDLGKDVYIGYIKYEGKYVPPKPFNSWVLNEFEFWAPPIPYPDVVPGKYWKWDDENVAWELCDECDKPQLDSIN